MHCRGALDSELNNEIASESESESSESSTFEGTAPQAPDNEVEEGRDFDFSLFYYPSLKLS